VQVVLRQQEGCELEAADFADLHGVQPAEGVAEQFAVAAPHCPLQVAFAQETLLLTIQEAEQRDAVEVRDFGEGGSVWLYCVGEGEDAGKQLG
jgi:hypothetical protein